MTLRNLGSTKLQVSPIGIGLAALGRPGYINIGHGEDLGQNYEIPAMEAHAHRVLDAAFEAGIRYFDAARSYGQSEMFLQSWLSTQNKPSESFVIGSKWGYRYTAGWQIDAESHEIKEHSVQQLHTQWHESQEILGDQIDLYQIHSATLESGVLTNTGVLQELAYMKERGVSIGLTTSGPKQSRVIELAIAKTIDGVRLFDCVQSTWNLLERSAGNALEKAHAAGLGVIVKEALANGRLTERGLQSSQEPNMGNLASEAQRLDTSIDGLALAAVLANPWVDVVLSGASTPEHLRSNLTALAITINEETEQNLSGLTEEVETYWSLRSALPWN